MRALENHLRPSVTDGDQDGVVKIPEHYLGRCRQCCGRLIEFALLSQGS